MNTAGAQRVQVPDIAAQVSYAMRIMGVSPIPRNYELFYEAYIGSNPKLTRELAALGSKASQEELDAIGSQYFGHHHRTQAIDGAHSKLVTQLDGLLRILRQEQTSLESYNRLLGETFARISNKHASSSEIIQSAIGILTEATGDTISQGKEMVENVVQKSIEMDVVRRELDEYKRIANTDSLTQLSNRRAFDDKLSTVYSDTMGRNLTALVLADIDHFKKINDTYGHPVGDKILASVGSVIRSNVRKDIFLARTGGEEFALLIEGNTVEEAIMICERVRVALEHTPFKNSKTGVNYGPVTISLGLCMASEADGPGELYSKADIALYCAKNGGRNRTVPFEEGMKKDISKNWLIYRR
ncbi:GGDEF domain-containing protein [Sinorhizobium sp. BG8]|uniref:GGDEF domain-containing protein n=1 Tax=Sinorhizobium sp. BG8 TaxID=2613773 RepID=UPI00193DE562|nr:GGDEF domain-containing protein [Sinorhizobium sp. BG8]QRM55692.1 GGDEF domain-containing protein [Sinorhizobium sp. BG8]